MPVSVRALRPKENLNWSLTEQNQHLATGLREVLRDMGVHKAYVPNTVPEGAFVVDRSVFTEPINLGEDRHLYQNRAVPADGMFLGRGHAFVTNCYPIIVAVAGEQMVVAQLVGDRTFLVVDAIVGSFLERGALLRNITMCLLFSIPELAISFEEHAHGKGLFHVWVENSLDKFSGLARTHNDELSGRRNLFVVKRNQPTMTTTTFGNVTFH